MLRRDPGTDARRRFLPLTSRWRHAALAFALAFGCVLLGANADEPPPPPPPDAAAPAAAPPEATTTPSAAPAPTATPRAIPLPVAAPRAAPPPADAAGGDEAAQQVAPDSPRASVRAFLDLCREGRYAEAARYLDVPPRADGAELAQRLKAVLDRHLWIEPETLSAQPLGDTQDNHSAGVEQLGKIPGRRGPEPVRLVRRWTPEGHRWIFSRATVERVDDWYARLDDRWLRDHLPPALLQPGPRELLWWQWLALPVLMFLGWIAGEILGVVVRAGLRRIVVRTASTLDDEILERARGPMAFAAALLCIAAALPWLGLYPPARSFLDNVLRAGLFVAFFWLVLRVIDAVGSHLLASPSTRDNPAARSLVPLMGRIAKVSILIIGVIAVLSELGYPVASLIAGLGIGGVAIALAAQKTVENVFGSVSIGIDRPLQVGDFVRVDTVLGTVETIGHRSTRIRTLDRTLVTIPNGKLADLQIESYTARDRMRLACVLALVRSTKGDQVRAVIEGCEGALRAHPLIWPDDVVVRFVGIGPSSLDVEIMAWFQTKDFGEFRTIRQELLLAFLEIVASAGAQLAYPTQTLHVASRDERPQQHP